MVRYNHPHNFTKWFRVRRSNLLVEQPVPTLPFRRCNFVLRQKRSIRCRKLHTYMLTKGCLGVPSHTLQTASVVACNGYYDVNVWNCMSTRTQPEYMFVCMYVYVYMSSFIFDATSVKLHSNFSESRISTIQEQYLCLCLYVCICFGHWMLIGHMER